MKIFIYALKDPITNEIRYIGKTKLKDFGDVFMYKSSTDVYTIGELLEKIILNKI